MVDNEHLVKDLFDNFPEYAICLVCTKWDYVNFQFKFFDEETGREHTINFFDAVRAFDMLTEQIDAGKFPGLGLSTGYKVDAGLWDASAIDALAQMAIFGEVIYG